MQNRRGLALGVLAALLVLAGFGVRSLRTGGPAPPASSVETRDDADPPGAPEPGLGVVRAARLIGGAVRAPILAQDGSGNVVVVAALAGTVDFGGGPLTSGGDEDVVVAKLDPAGAHLWSKRFGGPGVQVPAAVAVDAAGNVVVVGTLDQTADFGGGPLTSAGMTDLFVVKLDPSGKHLWSKRFGDAEEQEARGVAVDRDGSVVVAGSFEGTLDFGGAPLKSEGEDDVYVAKLDASGEHVWSRRFGDARGQRASTVLIEPSGAVVIAGRVEGSIDFGGGALTAGEGEDLYVARLDRRGTSVGARTFKSAAGALADPRAMVATQDGGLVIAGSVHGGVDFGHGVLPDVGLEDAFVVTLGPSLDTRFARRFGATRTVEPRAVAALAGGGVAMVGRLDGDGDFDGKKLKAAGRDDLLVVALEASGAVLEARAWGSPDRSSPPGLGRQAANAAFARKDGALVVAGDVHGAIDFGTGPVRGPGMVLLTLGRER